MKTCLQLPHDGPAVAAVTFGLAFRSSTQPRERKTVSVDPPVSCAPIKVFKEKHVRINQSRNTNFQADFRQTNLEGLS